MVSEHLSQDYEPNHFNQYQNKEELRMFCTRGEMKIQRTFRTVRVAGLVGAGYATTLDRSRGGSSVEGGWRWEEAAGAGGRGMAQDEWWVFLGAVVDLGMESSVHSDEWHGFSYFERCKFTWHLVADMRAHFVWDLVINDSKWVNLAYECQRVSTWLRGGDQGYYFWAVNVTSYWFFEQDR